MWFDSIFWPKAKPQTEVCPYCRKRRSPSEYSHVPVPVCDRCVHAAGKDGAGLWEQMMDTYRREWIAYRKCVQSAPTRSDAVSDGFAGLEDTFTLRKRVMEAERSGRKAEAAALEQQLQADLARVADYRTSMPELVAALEREE